MKTLIIYHQTSPGIDCPDAIAAAWAAVRDMRRGWDEYDILGWRDQTASPNVSEYGSIYVLGVAFSCEVVDLWEKAGNQVTVLCNPMGSSAVLTWEYFHSHSFSDRKMPAFLEYIRDRELGKSEADALPMCEEINAVFDNMRSELQKTAEATGLPARGLIFTAFDYLATLSEDDLIELFADRGAELLKPKSA